MEKNKETDFEKIARTNKALKELAKPWTKLSIQPPLFQVKQLSRMTGLSPTEINLWLNEGRITTTDCANKQWFPVKLNGTTDKPVTKSLEYAQILATIQAEGQRYQRGAQFPEKNKGKTTTRKAANLANIAKQAGQSFVFSPTAPTKEKVPSKKEQRRKVKYETKYVSPELWISKAQRQQGQEAVRKFTGYLETDSVIPPQGKTRIKDIIFDAVVYAEYNRRVQIANWICPPGTALRFDPESGKLYRRYTGLDPEQGLISDYRLYPRLDQERGLIRALERSGIPYRYSKLVADDNPYCLYPPSFRIDGKGQTLDAINNFTKVAQQKLDQWVGLDKIRAVTMSECLGPELFNRLLDTFARTQVADLLPFLPSNVLDVELDIMAKHTSLDPVYLKYLPTLIDDVLVQYGVEGFFVPEALGENTILAWNESTRRSSIIDSLRRAKGLDPLPKIFVLYAKKEGKIVNNF